MNHEREHGRIPDDISAENLGFDIRSRDVNGKLRYIEESQGTTGGCGTDPERVVQGEKVY